MAKRVFFSFHYKDVINFRVNVVRNHKLTKNDNAGYLMRLFGKKQNGQRI